MSRQHTAGDSDPARDAARRRRVVIALFCLSGVVALVIESVWLRWFRVLFGATAPAVSATLVALLAGQAGGAAIAARRLARSARPLAVYGALEIGAGLWALAVPLLLRVGEGGVHALYEGLRETPALLGAARFGVALLATLPASLCLGATLPAIGAALIANTRGLGRVGVGLYAVNLLGAAIGAGLSAFWLPDWLGVPVSYASAALLGVAVGVVALAVARAGSVEAAIPTSFPPSPALDATGPRLPKPALSGLAALSGLGSFGAQVLLVQAFDQVLSQSAWAFGAVLVVVLSTLAAGAGLVAWIEGRGRVAPLTLLGAALALSALGLTLFPTLLHSATGGLAYVGSGPGSAGYLGAAIATALVTAGPPLLALALVFPAIFSVGARSGDAPVASRLGRWVAANTIGAIAGALAAPYLLLPAVGLWPGFAVLGLLYAAAAVALPDVRPRGRAIRIAMLGAAALVLWLAANPLDFPSHRIGSGERVVFESTSATGLVAVIARGDDLLIRTDNHYSLGGTSERIHEERQGHLPLLLRPGARRVAYVGTATGITAGAALAHPVESITLVEIVPDVAEAAAVFFGDANRGIYADSRARTIVDDARNYLAATSERFDVVVADLFVPWRSGTGSLYTREHFEAVRERLSEDGLFAQWLPLYQLDEAELRTIAATFLDVFPRSGVWRGDFFGSFPIVALVGYKGRVSPALEVSEAARALGSRGESDRWVTDPVGVWSLYAGPLLAWHRALSGVPRNSDAHPRIEYLAARSHAGGERGKLSPMVGLRWIPFGDALTEAAGSASDPLYPGLAAPLRRASQGGALLKSAGALFASGRTEQSGQALAAASARLPSHLLSAAPSDPSAAEVWGAEP